jgi:peptidyl-prolyl cis-trans isomerase B (cyclophilin B)
LFTALLLALAFGTACTSRESDAPAEAVTASPFQWPSGPRPTATIHVAGLGRIELELYPELAPRTVQNFVDLARTGFYDGTTFHRVIPGFMIQGGDPNSRTPQPNDDGEGGPGYTIPDEFSRAPHERGVLAMANNGHADSAGSQFFVVQQEARDLDGAYTVFGRVTAGLETVDAVASVERDQFGRWGPRDRPIANVVIERIEVHVPGEASSEGTAATPPGAETPTKG